MAFDGIKTEQQGVIESAVKLSRGTADFVDAFDGFGLQISNMPAGAIYGPIRFVGHCVFAQFSPRAPILTKSWKECGKEKQVRITCGEIALSSGQEIEDLHWDQAQCVVALAIDGGTLARMSVECRGAPAPELRLEAAVQDESLKHMILALAHERRTGGRAGRVFSEMLGSSIASYVLQRYSAVHRVSMFQKGGLAPLPLRRVKEYVRSNLARDLSLSELAGLVQMSPWHFGKAFKISTGETVHQYILNCRMSLAEALLKDKRFRICDAAAMVGIPNQSHFAAMFHKRHGCTPTQHRRRHSIAERG